MRRLIPVLLLAVSCARAPSRGAVEPEQEPSPIGSERRVAGDGCQAADSPDSAAGRRLDELLAVMNAPDHAAAEAFIATALDPRPRELFAGFIRSNAGDDLEITLCRVEVDSDNAVVGVLGGPDERGRFEYGVVVLLVGDAGKVSSLRVTSATEADAATGHESIGDSDVHAIVEGVGDGLADYVFADKAEAMATRIRTARDGGEYAGITNGHLLAHRLMEDLFAVSHDKHLDLNYQSVASEPPTEPTPEERERFGEMAARNNYGMPVAEIREANIGYLKVLGFHPPQVAAEATSATMSKLADADALVIDLRENGGGSPHGVAYMSSYLFGEERVHLNDLYNRGQDSTESFYTSPDLPGRRFGPDKPIFVLTSTRTFSAAEEFAYNLQARGRATIVGEVTGGGAHPVELVGVSEHWSIILPTARAINPITKTNWEGTGVKPDVDVPAEDALDKALELARTQREGGASGS